MEKRLRCKDCKWFSSYKAIGLCVSTYQAKAGINAGRFACKKFVYKDK